MVIEDLVLLLRAATDSSNRMCVSESLVRLLVVNRRCVILLRYVVYLLLRASYMVIVSNVIQMPNSLNVPARLFVLLESLVISR